MREFNAISSEDAADSFITLAYQDSYSGYRETLKTVSFTNFLFHHLAVETFLRHVPRPMKLTYSHSPKINDSEEWNMSEFVTAIEREVGNHLEEFSISITDVQGSVAPGKVSMRGFKRLKKLEFPLEIAMCNIADAESRLGIPPNSLISQEQHWGEHGLSVGDIVPATVCHLSIILSTIILSSGMDAKILKVLFSNFAAMKDSHLPALKEIRLRLRSDSYEEECANLVVEMERVGVVLMTTRVESLEPAHTFSES